jgi:hypothetical protein
LARRHQLNSHLILFLNAISERRNAARLQAALL